MMKVLPSNLDGINDIEKIADEFYFKKEDNVATNMAESDENDENRENAMKTETTVGSTEPSVYMSRTKPIEYVDETKNTISNEFDGRNNGLRDVRSTLAYDELHNPQYLSSHQPIVYTAPTASETTVHTQAPINTWNNTKYFETQTTVDIDFNDDNDIINSNGQMNAKIFRLGNDFSEINIGRSTGQLEEDYDASPEDVEIIKEGPKVWRNNKIRNHTSYQKVAVGDPFLQQGFIATPGYPKFYVATTNCSWRITVPRGQRIRLVVLDIHLRCKSIKIFAYNEQLMGHLN